MRFRLARCSPWRIAGRWYTPMTGHRYMGRTVYGWLQIGPVALFIEGRKS